MKPDMGIFTIRSNFNDKCYIEGTKDLKAAIKSPKFKLDFGNNSNKELQQQWKEQGESGFTIEIVLKLWGCFKMDSDIKTILYEKGADIVRYVDISELSLEQTQGFAKAIIFCMALSKRFVSDTFNNMQVVHDEYLEKDQKVNDLAEWLAIYIQQRDYRAYAQSENNNLQNGNYDRVTRTSTLPHKTIARLAGMGFIGRSNLLVTEDYGSAFCMCTVLTDAPILVEKYPLRPSKCGKCDICKRICPGKAIHGNEWTERGGRENLVDVFKCSCPLKCMINCPWTLKYAGVTKNVPSD